MHTKKISIILIIFAFTLQGCMHSMMLMGNHGEKNLTSEYYDGVFSNGNYDILLKIQGNTTEDPIKVSLKVFDKVSNRFLAFYKPVLRIEKYIENGFEPVMSNNNFVKEDEFNFSSKVLIEEPGEYEFYIIIKNLDNNSNIKVNRKLIILDRNNSRSEGVSSRYFIYGGIMLLIMGTMMIF